MTDTRYIEIIGLPGSGKTTVTKLLEERLKERGVDSVRRKPLNAGIFRKVMIIFELFVFVLKTPCLFRLWFYSIELKYRNLSHVRSVVWNIRSRFFLETAIIKKNLSKNKKILINDEGLIGRLVVFSILVGVREELMIEWLNKVLPLNTMIVYVRTSNDVAISRVLDRGTVIPFFHDMDIDVRMNFYKINTEVYDRLSNNLKNKTIVIVNNGTNDELEKELERIIAEIN